MRALLSIGLFALVALVASSVASNAAVNGRYEEGGPGGGGGGGAGGPEGPGGNGGDGGGVGGGEGGQGGWGGPVSEGTDAECTAIAAANCPATDDAGTLLLVNPTDCGSFCMCASGVGKFMPCADGLHFSTKLQACTWPWEAQCKSTFLPPTLN